MKGPRGSVQEAGDVVPISDRLLLDEKQVAAKQQDRKTAEEELAAPFRKQSELDEKQSRLANVLAQLTKEDKQGGASKQTGAILPRMKKLPKGHVPKGDYPTATQVGLIIYRQGKTSLKDFRAAAIEKIGGWIEKESGLLWKTVRQLDIEEPAHLGEHLKTATRPKRDKTMLDWLSEAFFTTGHRAAQARGHLETAWGMKKGSLVGSAEDIEAAINRMTRLGGKIESTVLRGFMDADGNRITKGLPEIQNDLKKAKVDPEDFQVFMRAMRENSISRRPGNIAIGPERVMANEVAIDLFREKYKGKEQAISRAAQDFMDFKNDSIRLDAAARPMGADGERWLWLLGVRLMPGVPRRFCSRTAAAGGFLEGAGSSPPAFTPRRGAYLVAHRRRITASIGASLPFASSLS